MTDFILECTIPECTIPDEERSEAVECSLMALEEQINMDLDTKDQWVLHMDGSFNSSGSRVGIILTISKGVVVEYALQFEFSTTNNKVECEVLNAGLRLAKDVRAKYLKVLVTLNWRRSKSRANMKLERKL